MAHTTRNVAHVKHFRKVKTKRAKVNQIAYLEEILDAGFNPRPRDKAYIPTSWDDLPVSALGEIWKP